MFDRAKLSIFANCANILFNKNKKPFQKTEKAFCFYFICRYLILWESSSIFSIGFNAFRLSSSSMTISGSSYFIHR